MTVSVLITVHLQSLLICQHGLVALFADDVQGQFFRDHGITMFVCFLDASKAFDRVDYSVLFRKLVDRKFPAYMHIL